MLKNQFSIKLNTDIYINPKHEIVRREGRQIQAPIKKL